MASAEAMQTKIEPPLTTSNACPLDGPELGRATWGFLHTMGAYYPERASIRQQEDMKAFLRTFSQFYPCGSCADHLRNYMKTNPPRLADRHDLEQWLCEAHNEVNEMLGKPRFDCTKVAERWRLGPRDGSCGPFEPF